MAASRPSARPSRDSAIRSRRIAVGGESLSVNLTGYEEVPSVSSRGTATFRADKRVGDAERVVAWRAAAHTHEVTDDGEAAGRIKGAGSRPQLVRWPAWPTPGLTIVPANEASWEDLQTVFGTRGQAARCQCQRYKLRPRESFGSFPAEERGLRLREQTDYGHPESDTTSGLVAYLDGDPVGWCAVEPRTAYEGLLRNNRVPWQGRAEDKADGSVWAVTCLFTRAGFRKRGVSRALARAAVEFARARGARAIEGYPMTTKDVIAEELHVGTEGVFAAAGFAEVSRPTLRRVVMRIDFPTRTRSPATP
jgi:GNAT superfamily N-acetyltransferase